jgi:hypothetical protein
MEIQKSEYDRENYLWHFMTIEEQREYYDEVLTRVINNPRFYLDNLEELDVFKVSFIKYHWTKRALKIPFKYVENERFIKKR